MPIKDPFSYSARWDTIGLDCSNCVYFIGPESWPDENRISRCSLHKLSLAFELRADGYKQGEWFCKNFEDNGAVKKAIIELDNIRDSLESQVLYGGYGREGICRKYHLKS